MGSLFFMLRKDHPFYDGDSLQMRGRSESRPVVHDASRYLQTGLAGHTECDPYIRTQLTSGHLGHTQCSDISHWCEGPSMQRIELG